MTTNLRPEAWIVRALLISALASLFACGGSSDTNTGSSGGGTGGTGGTTPPATTGQPFIQAQVLSFQPGSIPDELILGVDDSFATVLVLNQAQTAPIANAVVRINGTTLTYDAKYQDYSADLLVAPGGVVNLDVAIDSAHYTASSRQFDTYPSITVPLDYDHWRGTAANTIRWNSTPPHATDVHLVAMLGNHSEWPSDGSLLQLPGSQTSLDIPAAQLADDDYLLLVGIGEVSGIAGAQANSRLAVAGFGNRHVSVQTPAPVATLSDLKFSYWIPNPLTIAVTASRTVTLDATWSDGGSSSVDQAATWTSSNPAVVAIQGPDVIRGVAAGTAVVSASYGGRTATLTVNVFAPTQSPTGTLTDSVTLQVDPAHSGAATLGGRALTLPLAGKWTANLNGTVSYPVSANGKVYVTTSTAAVSHPADYGTSLYALDAATGAVMWGPVDIPGTYNWSGHAYDNGKLFVLNSQGVLRSFDAATGAAGWTVQMTQQSSFSSVPVAVNGLVYISGSGSGSTVYAINEADGAVVWSAPSVSSRTLTLSGDGLFAANECRVTKFDPLTGEVRWYYSVQCSGGSDMMSVYADNRLYVRRSDPAGGPFSMDTTNAVFDATTGAKLAILQTNVVPAVAGGRAFYLSGTTLSAVDASTGSTLWSFAGDQNLVTAPLVIDNVVVMGSKLGAVYMLDAVNGNVLWTGQVDPEIRTADQYGVVAPSGGLGLGGGYLLVPAGKTLTGWRLVP